MNKRAVATAYSIYECADGFGIVAASETGVVAHHLPYGLSSLAQARETAATLHPEARQDSPITRAAAEVLSRYFAGEAVAFEIPLDLTGCTQFQQRVYHLVAGIAYGSVKSYADVAALCGSPKGARAIGGAMARNAIPILIPCHRVLGASGMMTGFTAPGGVASKKKLLLMEGAFPSL